jgi:hypothetical protein
MAFREKDAVSHESQVVGMLTMVGGGALDVEGKMEYWTTNEKRQRRCSAEADDALQLG